jgi:hypothetical protein
VAAFFWVGGTGTWDSTTTTHWSASTGGAGGAGVPGSADTVTFDGASGGGTVTLNFGGTITIQSLTCGAFTGTLDNSVNNNNITMTANGGFSGSGAGVRTFKLGTATYTLSGSSASWNINNAANLTFSGASSTITFTSGSGPRLLQTAATLTYGTLNLGSCSGAGFYHFATGISLANLHITAPCTVEFATFATVNISNAFTWTGSASLPIGIISDGLGSQATIAAAAGSTASWCAFRDMAFTGSPVASNSFDLLNNSGITITGPSAGASGMHYTNDMGGNLG